MKKILLALLLITVLMVPTTIMAQDMELDPEQPADPDLAQGIDSNNIVAVVNGQEITAQQLTQQANVNQLLQQISQMDQQLVQILANTEAGNEVLDEYQKAQLDNIIDNLLLEQKAEAEGITLTEEEADEIYEQQKQSILQQNQMTEEQFLEAIQQQGFGSEEEYKEMFADNPQIKVNKLIEEEVLADIEVTEEELEQAYEENQAAFAQAGQDASFEELRPQIEQMLRQQKQGEVINEYLEQLREEADIERNI